MSKALRKGQHPREPGRPGPHAPEADTPAQLPDGTDLGAKEEEEAKAQPDDPELEEAIKRSIEGLDKGAGPEPEEGSEHLIPHRRPRSSAKSTLPQEKGNPLRDAVAGSLSPQDWTRFDVSSALRALRQGNDTVQFKELRKLHLRWWGN